MDGTIYSTSRWRAASFRARARDGARCTVARLLGGPCRGRLHAHHVVPVGEGGERYALDNLATVCAGHHPQWEALRRQLARRRVGRIACPHSHRSLDARLICEARLVRQWASKSP